MGAEPVGGWSRREGSVLRVGWGMGGCSMW